MWTYNTAQGTDYCDYKYDRDYYSAPKYTYSFVPNDGDLLGTTSWSYTGNDDVNGYPSAVAYAGGSFANGDCPNLVTNSVAHPQCSNGVLCKLTWATNTTVGATTYPLGRYTGVPYLPGGMPFTTNYAPPYPSAEPLASLTDPSLPHSHRVHRGLGRPDGRPRQLLGHPDGPDLRPVGLESAEPGPLRSRRLRWRL